MERNPAGLAPSSAPPSTIRGRAAAGAAAKEGKVQRVTARGRAPGLCVNLRPPLTYFGLGWLRWSRRGRSSHPSSPGAHSQTHKPATEEEPRPPAGRPTPAAPGAALEGPPGTWGGGAGGDRGA